MKQNQSKWTPNTPSRILERFSFFLSLLGTHNGSARGSVSMMLNLLSVRGSADLTWVSVQCDWTCETSPGRIQSRTKQLPSESRIKSPKANLSRSRQHGSLADHGLDHPVDHAWSRPDRMEAQGNMNLIAERVGSRELPDTDLCHASVD